MSRDDVHNELQEIFRDVVDEDVDLVPELSADDVEAWDSLAHVNLIFAIEEQFGIEFTQAEMADMANIGELEGHIIRKLGP